MGVKSCNVPTNIAYSAIGAESLRIARASNNTGSFVGNMAKGRISKRRYQEYKAGQINTGYFSNGSINKGYFSNDSINTGYFSNGKNNRRF